MGHKIEEVRVCQREVALGALAIRHARASSLHLARRVPQGARREILSSDLAWGSHAAWHDRAPLPSCVFRDFPLPSSFLLTARYLTIQIGTGRYLTGLILNINVYRFLAGTAQYGIYNYGFFSLPEALAPLTPTFPSHSPFKSSLISLFFSPQIL